MMKLTYFVYLLIAVWQDIKVQKISVWVYAIFGAVGILENFILHENAWREAVLAMLPGLLLLFLTKCSRGAIGSGDGWFFLISSVYLGLWGTVAVFIYGLLFCSACSLGIVVWGFTAGVSVKKMRLPFLPFLMPAWFLVTLL